MNGLSLRLVAVPRDGAEPLLRLYLVNGGGEPRPYFVSDKLNPTHLVIRDGSGRPVEPQQDARVLPDFDSAAPKPEVAELGGHGEALLREATFIVPRKEAGADYIFEWRPFYYARFAPGTYHLRAIWRSSRGFSGELSSNEITVVLPVPQ